MRIRQCGRPQRLNDGIRLPGTRVNRQCELPNMAVENAYMFSSTVPVKYNTTVLWELGMNPEPPPTHKCTHSLEMVPIKFVNYLKAPMSIHSSPHPVTHDSLRHAKTAQGPHPTETKLLLTSLTPQSITRQSVGAWRDGSRLQRTPVKLPALCGWLTRPATPVPRVTLPWPFHVCIHINAIF